MPTSVGILSFISMINIPFEGLKARNFVICRYFSLCEQLKFRAQLSWAWKPFSNLRAWQLCDGNPAEHYQYFFAKNSRQNSFKFHAAWNACDSSIAGDVQKINQCNRFNFDFFSSFFTRNGKTKSYTGIQKITMDSKSSECRARQYGDQILSYIIGKIQRNTPSKNNASASIRQCFYVVCLLSNSLSKP